MLKDEPVKFSEKKNDIEERILRKCPKLRYSIYLQMRGEIEWNISVGRDLQ